MPPAITTAATTLRASGLEEAVVLARLALKASIMWHTACWPNSVQVLCVVQ